MFFFRVLQLSWQLLNRQQLQLLLLLQPPGAKIKMFIISIIDVINSGIISIKQLCSLYH